MKYNEIIVTIPTETVQTASDILDMLSFGGMYIEDYSDLEENEIVKQVGLVDENLLQKDRTKALIHVYISENFDCEDCIAFVSERFTAEKIPFTVATASVDELDYANSWKQYYKPFRVGSMTVVPEWEEYFPAKDEIILRINPGMAFGTGTHETTSMCMEALQDYVHTGDAVLDVGCGSGVLSATALICGAERADALDIDPNAVKVARENVALNVELSRFSAQCGNILDENSETRKSFNGKKYNVIVANIVADIIIVLSSFIDDYLCSDGVFIMSGIITEREDDVKKALAVHNWNVLEVRYKKGWVCLVAKR